MARCYDSYGNEDPGRVPCSQDGSLAQCCSDGEACSANGLCLNTVPGVGTDYWLNTCSDRDWMNVSVPTCPSQCAKIRPQGGNGVTSCSREMFCCTGYGSCDCNNANETFFLGEIRSVTRVTTATLSPSSTVFPSSTSATAESDYSATSLPPASTGDAKSDNNLSVGLGVGLGVGIPLLIGALAAFWFIRHRRRRAPAGSVPMEAATPSLQDKRAMSELGLTLPKTMQQGPPQELPTKQARAPLELQ